MKNIIYVLIISLLVVSGLVFANRENKKETPKKIVFKQPTSAERKAAREKWESTPAGVMFKLWEVSPEGKKVYASENNIRKSIREFTNMEAVVTSLVLPAGSRVGFGMMVNIKGDDFILSFGPENKKEFEALHKLKAKDKIWIKSRYVSHAPKYKYPILAGEIIELDGKVIYKRAPNKGGC